MWPPSARRDSPGHIQPQDAALTSIGRSFRLRLAWILAPQMAHGSRLDSLSFPGESSDSKEDNDEYLPGSSSGSESHTLEGKHSRRHTQASARPRGDKSGLKMTTTQPHTYPRTRATSKNKGIKRISLMQIPPGIFKRRNS